MLCSSTLIGFDRRGNLIGKATRANRGGAAPWWITCGMDHHAEPSRAAAADYLCRKGAFRVALVAEDITAFGGVVIG